MNPPMLKWTNSVSKKSYFSVQSRSISILFDKKTEILTLPNLQRIWVKRIAYEPGYARAWVFIFREKYIFLLYMIHYLIAVVLSPSV